MIAPPAHFGETRLRIRYTRAITLRRWPVVAGETWDTWVSRIAPDGSIEVDGFLVAPGYWEEVARWHWLEAAPEDSEAAQ